MLVALLLLAPGFAQAAPQTPPAGTENKHAPPKQAEAPPAKAAAKPEPQKPAAKPEPATLATEASPATEVAVDPDDEVAAENAEAKPTAVALPVSPEPVQIYGWREDVMVDGMKDKLLAKLDTGALTSSIHAEEQELFERDGKKWVRFIVSDPRDEKPVRSRIEAPLVRIARIKEPNAESVAREVVRLSFRIGERKLRGEFTLNNRNNMLAPVLIGRSTLKDLGWVDPSRTHLAEQKLFR